MKTDRKKLEKELDKLTIKPGDKFSRWTVIGEDPVRDKHRNIKFICQCECGTVRSVLGRGLKKGLSKSCHCQSKIISRICPVCKKEFLIKQHKKRKFCSMGCCFKGRTVPKRNGKFIELTCDNCNATFKREIGMVNIAIKNNRKHSFCSSKCQQQYMRGANVACWKGGISRAYQFGYHTKAYKDWRNRVFTRDDYTCQACYKKGGYLHAHHKNGFTHFPEVRFDTNNGITLCKKCHTEVHSLQCQQNQILETLRLEARKITKGRKQKNNYSKQSAINFGVSAL